MAESSRVPIFDGHNDTLLHLALKNPGSEESFFSGRDGHIDLPRARAGGMAGGFFAMFVPTRNWQKEIRWRKEGPDGPVKSEGWDIPLAGGVGQPRALNDIMSMMASAYRLQALGDGEVKIVRVVEELTSAVDAGVLAMVLHMEGTEALKKDLDALGVLYEAGLRSLGPVWSRSNIFGHGVPFNFPDSPDQGEGLSDHGKALVSLCNEMGILVDLSHMNTRGFWDVAELSEAPLVATHSGAHALCPSPRNLTDDQLEAVHETGGIVGVNFSRGFLRADGLGDEPTSLSEIVRHVEYLVEVMGVDHVAFGSDFDGTQVPQDLEDVSGLPRLLDALKDRGFNSGEIRRIAYENWVRILSATWK